MIITTKETLWAVLNPPVVKWAMCETRYKWNAKGPRICLNRQWLEHVDWGFYEMCNMSAEVVNIRCNFRSCTVIWSDCIMQRSELKSSWKAWYMWTQFVTAVFSLLNSTPKRLPIYHIPWLQLFCIQLISLELTFYFGSSVIKFEEHLQLQRGVKGRRFGLNSQVVNVFGTDMLCTSAAPRLCLHCMSRWRLSATNLGIYNIRRHF
jgi:hypothetical protein